jgi:hypothetical protein
MPSIRLQPLAAWLLGAAAVVGGCHSSDPGQTAPPDGGLASAPSDPELARALAQHQPFVPVYRDDRRPEDLEQAGARLNLPAGTMDAGRGFYLAIHKDQLVGRWFLSAFLKQYYQSAGDLYLSASESTGGLFFSLGTRVVSLVVSGERLYLYDTDDRKEVSDVNDPEVIVEAFPLVTGFSAFERLPGAGDYLLIDPAAGLSRFGVEASGAEFVTDGVLDVDLAVAQRFRSTDDGLTFEKVFSGSYTRAQLPPRPTTSARASGTLGLSLRRYGEGEGFAKLLVAPAAPAQYFLSRPKAVTDQGVSDRYALKWNVKPGMTPIKWLITSSVDSIQQNPLLKDYDVFGALKAGIESWNEVFGFPVVVVEKAGPGDQVGQDDKNFFIVDPDPRHSSAFADVRFNPNTGEIRGASVHFYSGFVDSAHRTFSPTPAPSPPPTAAGPSATDGVVTWQGMPRQPLCDYDAADAPPDPTLAPLDGLTVKQKVERYLTHFAAHEVGHTFGLRHNFRGSLTPPSATVMDYLSGAYAAAGYTPGAYDVDAIHFLYGMSMKPAAQPFCSDSSVGLLAGCFKYDHGADPLHDDFAPGYALGIQLFFAGAQTVIDQLYDPTLAVGYGLYLLEDARVAATSQERLDAWHAALAPLQPPLPAGPASAARADQATMALITRLMTPSVSGTTTVPATPLPPDPALRAAVADSLGMIVVDAAAAYAFPTRRLAVDALRWLQDVAGYRALLDARAALTLARGTATGDNSLYLEDLVARIDSATSPYFTM